MPEKALTKSAPQLVEFDRRVEGGGEALAGALATLGRTIGDMRPDDVVLEIDSERMGDKASSHIRLRAYRHKDQNNGER